MTFLPIARTSLMGLRRDRASLALSFILPIAFFSIFAVIFGSRHDTVARISVILVDQDQSTASRQLVAALEREGSLRVETKPEAKKNAPAPADYTAVTAEAAVKAGDVSVALIIPHGWGANPISFRPDQANAGPTLELLNDASDTIAPQMVSGLLQKAGLLEPILDRLFRFAHTTGRLIASTVAACIVVAMTTGNSFLSILIPGELFSPAYRRLDLAAKNLSRTTDDSGTVVVPLIPWSTAGVFMSGTLGVPVTAYAPWAVFCYTGFLFALLYGFTGFAIAARVRDDETQPGS